MEKIKKYKKIPDSDSLLGILHQFENMPSRDEFISFGFGDEYYEIDFEIGDTFFNNLKYKGVKKISFIKCKFTHKLVLNSNIIIKVLDEQQNVKVNKSKKTPNKKTITRVFEDLEFEFLNCVFENIIALNNYTYNEKICFNLCTIRSLKIINAKFNRLFQVFNSIILEPSIFNKVDFKDNAVFTKSTFKSNLLFTYSTFEKLGIFSRVKFNNSGLDLSQSIINGNLTFFETQLDDYKSERLGSFLKVYDDAITKEGIIPDQNKRETFRIIKHQLLDQNNLIEAEKFAKFEKQAYMQEIWQSLKFNKIPSLITLFINLISNYFKTSWAVALIFIFGFAMIFDLWLDSISTIYLNTDNTLVKLINLTDFSFYDKLKNNSYAYRVYFAGKITVGFGIYQLIQAFRKFK